MLLSIRNVKSVIKIRWFTIFIAAVCVIFFITSLPRRFLTIISDRNHISGSHVEIRERKLKLRERVQLFNAHS